VTLFVDTSIFYAVADGDDRGNARAKAILRVDDRLLTTDHIVVEAWLLIRRRIGRLGADRFWSGVRGGAITVEAVSLADLDVAWSIGEAFADQDFSIVDRTSFVVMQRLGIQRVASFDSDFAIYRFGPRRERAFEVLG
jgi:predicted nucleic acid-binding protein